VQVGTGKGKLDGKYKLGIQVELGEAVELVQVELGCVS
jgi:hypothetical protein